MRFTFTNPQRCVSGTIGEPGERAFFIQVRSDNRVISVALEKAQVQAVANRLDLMIAEVKKANPLTIIESFAADDAPLETPVDEERSPWRGMMNLNLWFSNYTNWKMMKMGLRVVF
jgi:uncharacterized repeat protein (TIGR03847 family)